jgi:hypothetical protein
MAKKKKEVIVEEDGYYIASDFSEDQKSFQFIINSTQPMEQGDVIQAIEEWLHNNLLDGYQNIAAGEH